MFPSVGVVYGISLEANVVNDAAPITTADVTTLAVMLGSAGAWNLGDVSSDSAADAGGGANSGALVAVLARAESAGGGSEVFLCRICDAAREGTEAAKHVRTAFYFQVSL